MVGSLRAERCLTGLQDVAGPDPAGVVGQQLAVGVGGFGETGVGLGEHEAAKSGNLDKDVNPGNTTFIGGTNGGDYVIVVASDEAYCGFGGDDGVLINRGTCINVEVGSCG